MALTSLPFDNNYTAWKQHPLARVVLYDFIPGATDGRQLDIRNLLQGSTFDLSPVIRKNSYGQEITVAYKITCVLKVANNQLWATEQSLNALANNQFIRALFVFTTNPNASVDNDVSINTYYRQTTGSPAVTESKLSTSFQIIDGDITINIGAVLSKDAFTDANSVILDS